MITKTHRGFSLIGVMVAFFILTMGVLSVVSLLNSTISLNRKSVDRLIAQNLASDAQGIVRTTKEENVLNNNIWSNFLLDCEAIDDPPDCVMGYIDSSSCFSGSQKCTINKGACLLSTGPRQKILHSHDHTLPHKVKYNDTLGYYQVDNGSICPPDDTKFTRTIVVEKATDDEVTVIVKVTWEDNGTQTYTLESEYYNPFP